MVAALSCYVVDAYYEVYGESPILLAISNIVVYKP